MNSNHISAKVKPAKTQIALTWLMTIFLPILATFLIIDFFYDKHNEYAETQAIKTTFDKLTIINSALYPENYFQSFVPEVKKLTRECTSRNPAGLVCQIASLTEVTPVFSVFKVANSKALVSFENKPADIKNVTLPHRVLLRRFFSQICSTDKKSSAELSRTKLQVQQLFKALTIITLLKNKVARNFSYYLGGEIFFMLIEVEDSRMFSHGLLMFRGRDLKAATLAQRACGIDLSTRIVLKELNTDFASQAPHEFNSGIKHTKKGIIITKPTNQNFARYFLHKGGVRIIKDVNLFPFIEAFIPKEQLNSNLENFHKYLKLLLLIIGMCLSAVFLRFAMFGLDFSKSLKTRVIAAIVLVAIFPFAILGSSLYLYVSFDSYISELNLTQHIEIKIAQIFEELLQKIAQYETWLAARPEINTRLVNCTKKEFNSFARQLGQTLPFTEASLVTSKTKQFNFIFPERRSVFRFGQNDPIWNFIPLKTLGWFAEDGRSNRTAQHYFMVAGQEIKASFLGESMQPVGKFFPLNQGAVPVWVSTSKILDMKQKPFKLKAILTLRYELGPFLKSFYKEKKEAFSETHGNYKIVYGYFPTRQISNFDYWQGSFDSKYQDSFNKYLSANQNQTITKDSSVVLIRNNRNMAHKVIAIALKNEMSVFDSWKSFLILAAGYMMLVIFFCSRLLDLLFLEPVLLMARSAEKIARGAETWILKLNSGDEIESLNHSFANLIKGLQQRNALKNYVSETAYSEIANNSNTELYPGGEYQKASVLFVMTPELLTQFNSDNPQIFIEELNSFITICEKISTPLGGVIDKVIENTIMIVFRQALNEESSHCLRSAKAAIAIKQALQQRNKTIQAGIAAGQVISGRIGSYKGKLDFTVIGDTVNMAARLKAEAADSNSGIIISGLSMRLLKGKARVNFLRRSSIKGKSREFNIYELVELRY
jgi:hypothetical protein